MPRLVHSLQPYNIATLNNFSEVLQDLNELDFGPVNQLVLQKANKFAGFSLSSYSSAIAWHRWLYDGVCDKSYDSDAFFDRWPSSMNLWRGALPLWPSCDGSKDKDSSGKLAKRIVSETCRFIFLAGLEGTGHHFWEQTLPILNASRKWGCVMCPELYDGQHKVGFFSTYDASIRSKSATRIMKLMADADRSLTRQGGGIVPLNALCEAKCGMMSYPNFGGAARAVQIPDVRALATLAEDTKLDLRIVLMIRDPRNSVKSAVKRRFEKDEMHTIKTYTATLASLKAQLDLLDPSFIACWIFEKPTAGIYDLVPFMGSRKDPETLKNFIDKRFNLDHARQTPAPSAETDAAMETLMALHYEVIAKYCRFSQEHR